MKVTLPPSLPAVYFLFVFANAVSTQAMLFERTR